MPIVEEVRADVVVLHLDRRLDVDSAPELTRAVRVVLERGARLVTLDFAAVDYVSSVGLGACLESAKLAQAAGGRVVLAALSAPVREVFELTGIDRLFSVHATHTEAVASLRSDLGLTLLEELLLLALHDDGGRFVDLPAHALDYAATGAVLLDLCARRRLDSDLQRLLVVDATPTGEVLLDPTLACVAADPEPHTVAWWIASLVDGASDVRDQALERLVARGVLERKEGLLVWVGGERRYPVVDDRDQREVKQRVLDIVRSDVVPTPHDVAVVALADACAVFDAILTMDEMLEVRPRIAEVARMDLLALSMTQALHEAQRRDRAHDDLHAET